MRHFEYARHRKRGVSVRRWSPLIGRRPSLCFLLAVKQLLSAQDRNRYPNGRNGMAKRRTDDCALLHSPSKRRCRLLRLVDVQRGSASPSGGVHSPSLLVLAASGSRKRSFYTEAAEEQTPDEASPGRKITRASPVLMEPTSGCSSDRVFLNANLAPTCSETWPREDCTRLDTKSPKIRDKVSFFKQDGAVVCVDYCTPTLLTTGR